MIKSSPETKTNADWLKEELIVCLRILFQLGFSVSAIVCDNHSSNGSNFKNLLQHFNQDPDDLFIWYELRKIYLFYNVVHLVKNVRNNLLNYKWFFFSFIQFYWFQRSHQRSRWRNKIDIFWWRSREMLLLNLTYHLAQRESVFYVIFHQITFSNILAACMIQLDDKCIFQQWKKTVNWFCYCRWYKKSI